MKGRKKGIQKGRNIYFTDIFQREYNDGNKNNSDNNINLNTCMILFRVW